MDEELVIKNLLKKFGKVIAVNDVSFKVKKGEVFTLLGPSGCGKTTTLLCIAGIEKPDRGIISADRVYFNSEHGIHLPPENRNIGIVFQTYALWPHMTVYDNLAFPLKLRKYSKNEIRRRIKEVLSLVNLEGLEERYPYQLSGGQQQRVALARAIIYEPQILLLDEPLSNLDAKIRDQARFWLKDFQRKLRITVVYVTHDQAEAMVLSDRIGVMNEGRILQIGSPKDIYENPACLFIADFIGGANIIPVTIEDVSEDGYYICKIEEKNFLYSRSSYKFNPSDRCFIAFKPSHVDIYHFNEPSERENTINCRIVKKAYLGGMYDYMVILEDSKTEIKLRVRSKGDVGEEGDRVKIHVPPQEIVVIPREE